MNKDLINLIIRSARMIHFGNCPFNICLMIFLIFLNDMNGCLEAVLNESFIKPKTNVLLVSMPGDIWTSFKPHQKLPQKN